MINDWRIELLSSSLWINDSIEITVNVLLNSVMSRSHHNHEYFEGCDGSVFLCVSFYELRHNVNWNGRLR